MLGENRQKRGSGIVIAEKTVPTKTLLVAGVDAGSTETRVCLADSRDAAIFTNQSRFKEALDSIMTQYCIPSTYANVDDAREIAPVSANLEDNYDSTMVLISNTAEKPMLSRHRVVRGRKIQDTMGATSRYLDSSTSKTDNVIFYTNIIDGLGYGILQKYSGAIPEEVEIHLMLSVRPKELNNRCKQKMRENLLGEYMFCWRDVKVKMDITSLDFSTEPEAQISGTTTVYDLRAMNDINKAENTATADKLSYSDCFIHIEGGGSSIGVEVLRNGVILDACSSTFPLGGNYMAQVFIDLYREQTGRTITKEAANNALISCMLRDGKNVLDVSGLVSDCKNQVAMNIVESLRHEVIDTMSDLTLRDVEFISLGGRLFKKDAGDNAIGDYLTEYVHQISPNTEVFALPENFIAQGNLVMALNSEDPELFSQTFEETTPNSASIDAPSESSNDEESIEED